MKRRMEMQHLQHLQQMQQGQPPPQQQITPPATTLAQHLQQQTLQLQLQQVCIFNELKIAKDYRDMHTLRFFV